MKIRNAAVGEFEAIGLLMVDVYSKLNGFPTEEEQPSYYDLLRRVGQFTLKPEVSLLVAVDDIGVLLGTVVYFGDMSHYGSGGSATKETNSAGFRLLAVAEHARGMGIGKALTEECLKRAKEAGLQQVIIHSTMAMQTAWNMYEKMGFVRSVDLDFMQGSLPVFGFRYCF